VVQLPTGMASTFCTAAYIAALRCPIAARKSLQLSWPLFRKLAVGTDGRLHLALMGMYPTTAMLIASATSLPHPSRWYPPALMLALVVLVLIIETVWLIVHTPPPPAEWACLTPCNDSERSSVLKLVQTRSQEFESKYDFDLIVTAVHRVVAPDLRARFEDYCSQLEGRGKGSNVQQLFHGTSPDGARSICEGDFRLPTSHRHGNMFGTGIYFASSPRKSMQYCSIHPPMRTRTMLLCDVALGHTWEETVAPRRKLSAAALKAGCASFDVESAPPRNVPPTVSGQKSYNSVTASKFVRVPEFIIYDVSAAVPCYVLEVERVTRGQRGSKLMV